MARRGPSASLLALILLAGCASLPPGADYPKTFSTAFDQPATTRLGKKIAAQSDAHPGLSGFQVFPRGVDGLLMRTQLVRAARTVSRHTVFHLRRGLHGQAAAGSRCCALRTETCMSAC